MRDIFSRQGGRGLLHRGFSVLAGVLVLAGGVQAQWGPSGWAGKVRGPMEYPYDYEYRPRAGDQAWHVRRDSTTSPAVQEVLSLTSGPGIMTFLSLGLGETVASASGGIDRADTSTALLQLYIEQDGEAVFRTPAGAAVWVPVQDAFGYSEVCSLGLESGLENRGS